MKALYKYPQCEYPYAKLVEESRNRSRLDPEYEIEDAGVFDENRYFDVFAEYAKAGPDDILIQITIANRAAEPARIHLLPTIMFRNTWSWGCTHEGCERKPLIALHDDQSFKTDHVSLGKFRFFFETTSELGTPDLLFTENETNSQRIAGTPSGSTYPKDGFHDHVIHGDMWSVNPKNAAQGCALLQNDGSCGRTSSSPPAIGGGRSDSRTAVWHRL